MDFIEIKAKTVNDAITEATIQLGVTSDNLEYEVVDPGKSGFFGFNSKPAIIKARKKEIKKEDPKVSQKQTQGTVEKESQKEAKNKGLQKELTKEPQKDVKKESLKDIKKDAQQENFNKPQNESGVKADIQKKNESKTSKNDSELAAGQAFDAEDVVEKKPVEPVDAEEVKKVTNEFLSEVFRAMELEVEIVMNFDDTTNTMDVEFKGDDMGVLIGKRGQTLDSLQYLANLAVNKKINAYIKVKLDTENYRKRRKETLENLAKNIANKVKRSRRSVSLEPMNPFERRVIHSALQNDRYVATHSEGEEPFRHVVVTLKHGDRYDRGRGGRYRGKRDRDRRKEDAAE